MTSPPELILASATVHTPDGCAGCGSGGGHRQGTFTIAEHWLESRCGWSPYTGMELQGRVIGTIIRGHTAMREGQLANAAVGERLRFAGAMAG